MINRSLRLAAAFALGAGAVQAEDVYFVVPYSAGGPMDQIARILAPGIQEQLGETIVVDDRPGAGGMVGTNTVATAKPDGTTILLSSQGSHVLTSLTQKNHLPYDPIEDFTPIALVGELPAVLVARKDLPADNLDELIELAKTQDLNFASSGVGNSPHLAGELINSIAGLQMGHIPYAGAAPAIVDVIAGNVDFIIADIPVVIPHVQSGELKALAVFGPERSEALPDVPSSAEQGHPDMITGNYYFVMAPGGMDDATQQKLQDAVIKAAEMPEIAEKLKAAGVGAPADGATLKTHLMAELDKWRPFVEKLDLVSK